jgi:hypothetical protein
MTNEELTQDEKQAAHGKAVAQLLASKEKVQKHKEAVLRHGQPTARLERRYALKPRQIPTTNPNSHVPMSLDRAR